MEGFTYRSKGAASPKAQLDTDPEQLGLIARSISLLFENIKRKKKAEPHVLVHVKCSMVQIYKEQVRGRAGGALPTPLNAMWPARASIRRVAVVWAVCFLWTKIHWLDDHCRFLDQPCERTSKLARIEND
jgi:hypothetical protein